MSKKKKYNSTQIKQELVSVSVSVRINNDKKKPKQVAAFLTSQTNKIIQLIIIDNCVRYYNLWLKKMFLKHRSSVIFILDIGMGCDDEIKVIWYIIEVRRKLRRIIHKTWDFYVLYNCISKAEQCPFRYILHFVYFIW